MTYIFENGFVTKTLQLRIKLHAPYRVFKKKIFSQRTLSQIKSIK
jgi:hypothetical protein